MADDFVTVVLRRKTAEEVCNAYIIALGGSGYQKGKGKDDGGGKKDGGKDGKADGGGNKYPGGKKNKK